VPLAVRTPHGAIDRLLEELQTSRGGLTTPDARRRLGEAGPNEPARASRTASFVQILLLLSNPLVIILLAASAGSAILGQQVNASIIVLMVALSVVLNFVQTYRSHRVAERLRDAVAPTATALRDGTWTEIRRRELVPGDIVRLAAGIAFPPTRASSRRASSTSSRPPSRVNRCRPRRTRATSRWRRVSARMPATSSFSARRL
jgi:magnesium-transporting ATPase (P-type)